VPQRTAQHRQVTVTVLLAQVGAVLVRSTAMSVGVCQLRDPLLAVM